MPEKNILILEGIKKSFISRTKNETQVLKGINLQVPRAEFLALMGPSGAGKSTLLSLIACIDSPDSGEIIFNDGSKSLVCNNLTLNELSDFRNTNIGFVFQFHHLLPEFSAIENVMMPALISGERYKSAKTKAEKLIDKIGLDSRKHHKPTELSGGEQQRLAIARAIINEPLLILADEPTGNLDEENSNIVMDLLIELVRENSSTLIIATHSAEIAQKADRIIHLKNGILLD